MYIVCCETVFLFIACTELFKQILRHSINIGLSFAVNYFRSVNFQQGVAKKFQMYYVIRIRLTIRKITEIVAFIPFNGPI